MLLHFYCCSQTEQPVCITWSYLDELNEALVPVTLNIRGSAENDTGLLTSFPDWRRTTPEQSDHSEWHYMIWFSYPLHICTHTVYTRGHPPWLLSLWDPTFHTADLRLFEYTVYIWSELQQAPQMTKWLRVSESTNRPVLFQTGSWEQQRHCLVSSANSSRSLPTSSQQPCLMVCTTPCWTAVLISACVTHLLLVTLCCACLQVKRDLSKCASHPSVHVYRLGLSSQTGQHGRHHVEGQRPNNKFCAPMQLVSQAINPHSLLRMYVRSGSELDEECECSVLKNALSTEKACVKFQVEVRHNCSVDCI